MNKLLRIGLICALVLLLVLVRAFAPSIFYDPFINYFKYDFLTPTFPEVDLVKLVLSTFFRYLVNSLISMYLLYLIFLNSRYIKFAFKFYGIAFLILMSIYVLQVAYQFSSGYLFPFYIRRLLIQPVILLVLIPAFYYQNRKVNQL